MTTIDLALDHYAAGQRAEREGRFGDAANAYRVAWQYARDTLQGHAFYARGPLLALRGGPYPRRARRLYWRAVAREAVLRWKQRRRYAAAKGVLSPCHTVVSWRERPGVYVCNYCQGRFVAYAAERGVLA